MNIVAFISYHFRDDQFKRIALCSCSLCSNAIRIFQFSALPFHLTPPVLYWIRRTYILSLREEKGKPKIPRLYGLVLVCCVSDAHTHTHTHYIFIEIESIDMAVGQVGISSTFFLLPSFLCSFKSSSTLPSLFYSVCVKMKTLFSCSAFPRESSATLKKKGGGGELGYCASCIKKKKSSASYSSAYVK